MTEGAHLPRVGSARSQSQVGGAGRRCCWAMVRGGSEFHQTSGKSTARSEPTILRKRAEQAWRMRWCGLLACAAARAFAASLLERGAAGGADGETPTVHHVVNDWRFCQSRFGPAHLQSYSFTCWRKKVTSVNLHLLPNSLARHDYENFESRVSGSDCFLKLSEVWEIVGHWWPEKNWRPALTK